MARAGEYIMSVNYPDGEKCNHEAAGTYDDLDQMLVNARHALAHYYQVQMHRDNVPGGNFVEVMKKGIVV